MRTRSQLRAVTSDVTSENPTAPQSTKVAAKPAPVVEPTTLSDIKNTIKESTPCLDAGLARSSSLIPAYAINAGAVEDLQLESLLGTPYTCEVKASSRAALKPSSDLPVVDLAKEKMPEMVVTKPSALAASGDVAPEKDNEPMSIRKVKKAIKAIFASKQAAKSSNEPTQVAICKSTASAAPTEQADNAAELLDALNSLVIVGETNIGESEGPLRGIPRPVGAHLRFEEDGSVQQSPRQRVFLRGMPEPVGKHTHFD